MSDAAGRGREFVEGRFDRWWMRFLAKGLDRYDLRTLRDGIETWDEWCGTVGCKSMKIPATPGWRIS